MSDLRSGGSPSQDDIEMLLPWFVTGKLEPGDQRRVEDYLATHPAMRSQLALIAAEQTEAVHANEAIAPPSADRIGKLMAQIENGGAGRSPLASVLTAVQRALDWLGERSALAPAAAMALLVLLVQGGLIGALLWQGSKGPAPRAFQTASAPVAAAAADKGSYALAGFSPTATIGEIEQTLAPLGVTIVDGPRAGGIYRLRLSDKPLDDPERDILLTALKAHTGVVRFIAPTTP